MYKRIAGIVVKSKFVHLINFGAGGQVIALESATLILDRYVLLKMKKIYILLLIFISCLSDPLAQIDIHEFKLPSGDFYYTNGCKNSKKVIVLFAGFDGQAKEIFKESKIPSVAKNENILVIAIPTKFSFKLDSLTKSLIDGSLIDQWNKNKYLKDEVIIGGYSAGGTLALEYLIFSRKEKNTFIVPKKVFTVDSPVDIIDIYHTLEREIIKNCSPPAYNEAKMAIPLIQKQFGGSPKEKLNEYKYFSPYVRDSLGGENIKYLLNTPVRLHHDPDIIWQLENRCRDLFDMNELCASALINKLRMEGNLKAQLILNINSGYRTTGERHPHSWSIVDYKELLKWVKE